jgi:hypothetical protein
MNAEWQTTMAELRKAQKASSDAQKEMDKSMKSIDLAIKHQYKDSEGEMKRLPNTLHVWQKRCA